MNRAARKLGKSQATAVATEVNANSTAIHSRTYRRPSRSLISAGKGGSERTAEQQRAERDTQAKVAELEMVGQERARAH